MGQSRLDAAGYGWRLARDTAIAVVITVIAVVATYGEAHPTTPGTYFTGQHHLPHTPDAALLLVAPAARSSPGGSATRRLVRARPTAAVVAYTLPGYENGVPCCCPPSRWAARRRPPYRRAGGRLGGRRHRSC